MGSIPISSTIALKDSLTCRVSTVLKLSCPVLVHRLLLIEPFISFIGYEKDEKRVSSGADLVLTANEGNKLSDDNDAPK